MIDPRKCPGPDPKATQIILECISDGVFTIDYNWEITSFNRAAEEITGIRRKDAIGRHCWEVFRSNMCEAECALKKTMEEGKPYVSTSAYIIDSNQKKIPISVSTSLLIDKNGEVLGGVKYSGITPWWKSCANNCPPVFMLKILSATALP